MQSIQLGHLLVNFGLLTEAQLKQALELQKKRMPRRLLGELLTEEGLVSEKALRGILTVQRRKLDAGKEPGDAPSLSGEEALRARLAGKPLAAYLELARELDASDLHLSAGQRPLLRLNGQLKELPVEPLDAAQCKQLLVPQLSPSDWKVFEERRSVDASIHDPKAGRFRLHLFHHGAGIGAVLRVIADVAWEFEQLGLPDSVRQVCDYDKGLVLVTGAVGSGKSTTLAALLNAINRDRKSHIVTIEDPVEVLHRSDRSLVSQRQVGEHTRDFSTALRAALREDPDVIVVGEMRDLETTSIALTAAETGHLVFGTMHTSSADRTIHRILDQFPQHQREHARSVLANVLRCVVCQQLVPTVDGRHRVLASEVLQVTPAVSNLIREDRMHQIPASMQLGKKEGMCLMDDSLAALVKGRRIPLEEAVARAVDPERFMRPVAGSA
jgi:twitching motility protein PilT